MLYPNENSDLKTNTFVVGAEVISLLIRKKSFSVIEDIMKQFLKIDKRYSPDMFLEALTLLYAMGYIEVKEYTIKLIKNGNSQTTLFD